MEASDKLRKKISLLGISMFIMVALLVSACGNQSSDTGSLPAVTTTTPTGGGSATGSTTTTTASGTHVESSKPLTSVRMVSQSVGWATAQGATVFRTTDGGNHWIDVTPHYSDPPMEITSSFADGLHAWIGYVGMWDQSPITILRTTDGGQNWQSATISADQPTGVVSLQFRGSNYQQGWVLAGIDGGPGAGSEEFGLYTTIDGGQNWSALPSIHASDQMRGLSFLDTKTAFLAYGGPYAAPQLSVTHDGGRSWKEFSLPVIPGLPAMADEYLTTPPVLFGSSGLLPVYFSYSPDGKVEHKGFVIYTTSDGGATWAARNYSSALGLGGPLSTNDLYIVDQTHAYVTDQKGATWISTNGGASWVKLAGTVGSGVTSLSFTDSQHGWAAGGGLWSTTDGGNSWQAVNYTMLGA